MPHQRIIVSDRNGLHPARHDRNVMIQKEKSSATGSIFPASSFPVRTSLSPTSSPEAVGDSHFPPCVTTLIFSGVGKSFGSGMVTLSVAIHSTERCNTTRKPTQS